MTQGCISYVIGMTGEMTVCVGARVTVCDMCVRTGVYILECLYVGPSIQTASCKLAYI